MGSAAQRRANDPFRIVIISGAQPAALVRLIRRLLREAPGVAVEGLLYQVIPPRSYRERGRRFLRNLRTKGFLAYVVDRALAQVWSTLVEIGHWLLWLLHGGAGGNGRAEPEDLARTLETLGCGVLVTADVHGPAALDFVRGLHADLGIVFGTKILKPELYELPRCGSVNIHKRKVPDYRGGGPIGLWELLDGCQEIGVTVHQVAERVDSGDVLKTATIPIEPYDDLESLALKADIVGEDLLVATARDFADGCVERRPQGGAAKTYRSPAPAELRLLRRRLGKLRRGMKISRSRPLWKLVLRGLMLGPGAVLRNWRNRRRGTFPIVILYHHVIADRYHAMGMSTAQFSRQLAFLRRHYRVLPLSEAMDALKAGRVDAPSVVLTFDDGYRDNYLAARAALSAAGCSATFFVCSENLTTGEPFDHDRTAGVTGFAPLTWEETRGLLDQGFEIGSHTRTHFDCGSTDVERLRLEIVGAREDLERELGVPVDWFSFPWGLPRAMSAPAVDIARRAYELVFSACGGVNYPDQGRPPWHLLRCPHPSSLLELELTLQSLLELDPAGPRLGFDVFESQAPAHEPERQRT